MSMISAQCDELRKAAQTCRTLGGYKMEQTLLQAADTITELRGALQVASVDYRHLQDENAKLRELAHMVAEYTSADQCEGCVTKRACNAGELDMCWIRKAILEKLRELGMEVDG